MSRADARRLRVMQSYPALRKTTNPYLKQLHVGLAEHVDVQSFSWRDALLGRFDVLHVHWPEVMLRSPSTWRRWLRRGALAAILLRVRLSERALVRTVHNPEPHELGSRLERDLLRLVDRWTTLFVLLVSDTPVPVVGAPHLVIPHGHYRDWFNGVAVPASEPGRLAYVGLVRRYKGVEELLEVFGRTAADRPLWRLRIVGRSQDAGLTAAIEAAARIDGRITARLEYVPDADLADEVGRADLVVLPYREMHNSGSALLALSLGRPILVPENAITAALAAEMGDSWVQTYHPPLTLEDLTDAVRSTPALGAGTGPNLTGRDWGAIASAHADAYHQARALRRRGAGTPGHRLRRRTEDSNRSSRSRSERRSP